MAHVQVQGRTVGYTVAGTGPAVLLLHGTGASKDTNWGDLPARLAQRFTVLAVDLPGSGDSTGDPDGTPFQVQDTLAGITAAVAEAGLARVHVVGYSLGAALAVALAAEAPQTVQSLTLVAGYARADTYLAAQMRLWAQAFTADAEVFVRLALQTGMGPAFWQQIDQAGVEATVAGFGQILPDDFARQAALNSVIDTTAALEKITAPTLVVALTHDRMVPPAHSRQLAAGIAGARLVELDAGHLVPWENPQAFADVIVEHLNTQTVPA